MSDRKPSSSYEYTRVEIYDDDDKLLINNQEDSTCIMCCLCWIISKLKNVKEWLSGKINKIFRNRRVPERKDLEEPYKKWLVCCTCTLGWIWCLFKLLCCCIYGKPKSCIRFLHSQVCCCTHRADKRYQREAEKLREECKNLEIRLSDSQAEVRNLESKLSYTEEILKDQRREKKIFMSKFEEERKEKEKALTRLSSIAGDKLRLNNPGIADLSDENRPNKLGEKFSELYDNEWTEAYESLDNAGLNEEEIIKKLLDILKEVYNCCQHYAKAQRHRLIQVITLPSRSEEQSQDAATPEKVMSKVVDLQKQTASIALSDVKNTIITTRSEFADNEVKQKYMDRCMQLCWMMAIQDPPMLLHFGPAQHEDFDKNLFRLYTKQGNRVDFIVWPALVLHVNGPIVQKGVLQPTPS
ncbi:uncharacterized protein LOC125681061 isoform X2 [Ostrea edulis]|uniref:uncharacterized protein LOC125681061 isoform X2 n=1 Tax=Ostrea edulis TaxID=37623 RepID=UPI0024AF3735|nr:uncharacterized protein LOC125681061 isoform X2 [Ostrea edulis]